MAELIDLHKYILQLIKQPKIAQTMLWAILVALIVFAVFSLKFNFPKLIAVVSLSVIVFIFVVLLKWRWSDYKQNQLTEDEKLFMVFLVNQNKTKFGHHLQYGFQLDWRDTDLEAILSGLIRKNIIDQCSHAINGNLFSELAKKYNNLSKGYKWEVIHEGPRKLFIRTRYLKGTCQTYYDQIS